MSRVYVGICAFILLLVSCQQQDSLPERDVRPFDWKVVYTFPNENLSFPVVNRMSFNQHGLFIHDFFQKRIHRIDIAENEIVRSYGGDGNGPGEAKMILEFVLDEDRLIIIDTSLLRFTEFDVATGDVISTTKSEKGLPFDRYLWIAYTWLLPGSAILF